MTEYFDLLKHSTLFAGIEDRDMPGMLRCLSASVQSYQKDEILLLNGQPLSAVGLVLSGRVQIVKEDYAGNRTILTQATPGDLFAEAFACARVSHLPVTAVCASDCEILWADVLRIVSTCSSACPFHTRLIENLLLVLASKNMQLNQKIEHLSMRSTRGKLLSFLSDQAAEKGRGAFEIAFSRQELADYLCVDRSAMSAELSRMQAEGILRFDKNRFELLGP